MLTDDLREYLDTAYLAKLPHLAVAHPKLAVVFSGGNAVGKSTMSRAIQERFHGLVIENDGIKRTILKREPDFVWEKLNPVTWAYTTELYRRLGSISPNGLLVRDGVVDWYYDRIFPILKESGYELFIIEYDLSHEKQVALIEARGDTETFTAERALEILGDHAVHQKEFRSRHKADVVLTDDTVFDTDLVLEKLEKRLASMQ